MSEKFKFGFDTDALTEFVQEQGLELLTKSLFGGVTATTFASQIQEGIKYKDALNYMDTAIFFREDTGCGAITPSGDVIFTQKEIEVGKFRDEKTFCYKDLENFYTREYLPAGSYGADQMPLEQAFMTYYTGKIAESIETKLWQETSLFDGFNRIIDTTSGVINGNPSSISTGTGITTGNVIGIFGGMVDLLPSALHGQSDVEFVCGWDTYRKLLQAYFTTNNFFFNAAQESPYTTGSFEIPTYGLTVRALHGLTGTNRIHLSRLSNYVIGTDMMGDFDNSIQVWYEKKDELYYVRTKGKLGTQIKFGSELVTFKLV
jgi:hypothetical protein